jgi:hypothetical protein
MPHTKAKLKLKSRKSCVETFTHNNLTVVPFRMSDNTTGSLRSGGEPFVDGKSLKQGMSWILQITIPRRTNSYLSSLYCIHSRQAQISPHLLLDQIVLLGFTNSESHVNTSNNRMWHAGQLIDFFNGNSVDLILL